MPLPEESLAADEQLDMFETIELVPSLGRACIAEVTPGTWCATVPEGAVKRWALVEMIPQGDGSYRPDLVEDWSTWARLTRDLPQRLGVPGLSYTTLYRLVVGRWIEAVQPAPDTILISLGSLMAHLRRTVRGDDGQSWWTDEKRRAWSQSFS